ncbi:unnamed protein product [Coregonus sp. 'balchen']|nr:unnamed protein product [Coregonus sp. 'balchen']
MSINADSALYILLREPVGRKMLCVRVTADRAASSIKECLICEEDSTFALESSALSFPDLCRLVAFYCISRDVLPFPLELPEAIAQASSHRKLEAISHMGLEFWCSLSDTQNGPGDLQAPPTIIKAPPSTTKAPPISATQVKAGLSQDLMRVRVSTESSMTLSGGGGGGGAGSFPSSVPEDPQDQERLQPTPLQPSPNPHRKVHPGAGVLRRTPALSPTSAEDEDLVPINVPPPVKAPTEPPVVEVEEDPPAPEEPSIEEACQALEGRPAPSLAELDSSSSFSSLEEEEPEPEDQFFKQLNPNPQCRPPMVRSRGGHGGLHRMSAAFVCFFAPEKRLARLVEELSRDRRSVFGSLVQEFIQRQKEELREVLAQAASSSSSFSSTTSVGVLQGLRRFLSQANCFLLDSGELSPPLETLALLSLHRQDGSTQRLACSLLDCQEGAMERLGVLVGVPDTRGVERVRQKLALMQRTHSPIDKMLLLLQMCKAVQKAMGALHEGGQEVSSADFLPALSYVIVMCNTPQILLEVEYMMELLEPSWLTGEGGYYLTSVYASLCLIQSPEAEGDQVPPGGLTREAQDGLRETTTLYWRSGGEMRALPPQAQPKDLASHSEGGPSLSYLRTDHDFSKMRRLTRGGAVDLGESVCEE